MNTLFTLSQLPHQNYIREDLPLVQDTNKHYQTVQPMSLEQICSAMILLIEQQFERTDYLVSSESTKSYLIAQLANLEQEVFSCLYLDNQHRVISYETLFYGTISEACVYPREVVKACLQHNAAAVIFAHNHPSGNPSPSQCDKQLTAHLIAALKTVDIRVLDHIVIGGAKATSFSETGLL